MHHVVRCSSSIRRSLEQVPNRAWIQAPNTLNPLIYECVHGMVINYFDEGLKVTHGTDGHLYLLEASGGRQSLYH